VPRFHEELRESLRSEGTIYPEIRDKKELSDELTKKLEDELKKFADGFYVEGRTPAAPEQAPADTATPEPETEQAETAS
jgi:hypothetical protein